MLKFKAVKDFWTVKNQTPDRKYKNSFGLFYEKSQTANLTTVFQGVQCIVSTNIYTDLEYTGWSKAVIKIG